MQSPHVGLLALVCLASIGCQPGAGGGSSLGRLPHLGGATRVPPPATGSYASPNGYYQGQAAVPPAQPHQFAATGSGSPAAMEMSGLGGSGVQPVGYSDAGAVGSGVAFASAPQGANSAPAAAVPLGPQLRGMQAIDLTGGATPTHSPPTAQLSTAGHPPAVSNPQAVAVPMGSTSSGPAVGDSWQAEGSASSTAFTTASSAAGGGIGTLRPVPPGEPLPWRRPDSEY